MSDETQGRRVAQSDRRDEMRQFARENPTTRRSIISLGNGSDARRPQRRLVNRHADQMPDHREDAVRVELEAIAFRDGLKRK